jgi:hypothetical protein
MKRISREVSSSLTIRSDEMKCLIDGDILLYEVSSQGQFKDPLTGDVIIKDFDSCIEFLEMKLREIESLTLADEPSVFYFSSDETMINMVNRERKSLHEDLLVFKPNFRIGLATTKKYKGNRDGAEKPYHFYNLRAYMLSQYPSVIAEGIEADDLLGAHLSEGQVCCSRDKDLRQVPGLHFTWQCGKQPMSGPDVVEDPGELIVSPDGKKVKGNGLKFFFYQMLVGDATDNIPGCPGIGPKKALPVLQDLLTEEGMLEAVSSLYKERVGDSWIEMFNEQAGLLWIARGLDEDGNPVQYRIGEDGKKQGWQAQGCVLQV